LNIYLKHAKHGTKVATCEAEAEYDEKSGWVRFDPEKPVLSIVPQLEEARVKRQYTRRK
jgi:hypothetical protein